MAYNTAGPGLRRLEDDSEENPFPSTKFDIGQGERFVEGQIARDLPAFERPGPNATAKNLEDAIKNAVIPRLYARRMVENDKAAAHLPQSDLTTGILKQAAIEHLHRMVLAGQSDAQEACLHEIHAQGLPLRRLLEDVVVPVADELGRAWEEDLMSFAEVSLKVGRFQKAVSNFTSRVLPNDLTRDKPTFLMSPAPGEQHSFGASVFGNLLIAEGFPTDIVLDADAGQLCDRVRERSYSALGLSCNSDRTLPILKTLIAKLRQASCNRAIRILVGGWALQTGDKSLSKLDADLVVTDGRRALDDVVRLFERGE
ncbi:B12-binding domain-containing protein [Fulvimarina sp. 2208YS6-2-32]|uniref:B12-binding domain-containing protein n=1 Tax=Fulvimarina uroteuthidis TaxID=3098149 RepID=A0ABU5I2V1_9HYPH|nr:B12-binding domain-containing protein [Fulvimarina sp. 2208YS6-2-32]MDY8108501.1 B12-binding domain-containing protein [Fulvimarina sp. 2208YS6-2-32]